MLRSIFFLSFLCFGLWSCQTKPAEPTAGTPVAIVKFQYFDNRVVVPVWLNEKGPFHMIFDTGGSNVLMPEVAKQLQMVTQPAGMAAGAGDTKIPMSKGRVQKVRVGSIPFKDQDFLVMDLSMIKKAFGFKQFDGVVGYEWLQKYGVTIDYDNNELSFFEFDKFNPQGASVSFELFGNKPVIPGQVMDESTKILIDTGDRSSFTVFKKHAQQHSMGSHFGQNTVISGYGVGGPIPAKLGKVPKLVLGDSAVSLTEVPARLPTTEKGFFARSDFGGSVGNGLLQNYVVSFNYRDKVMHLEKGLGRNGEYHFVPPKKMP